MFALCFFMRAQIRSVAFLENQEDSKELLILNWALEDE